MPIIQLLDELQISDRQTPNSNLQTAAQSEESPEQTMVSLEKEHRNISRPRFRSAGDKDAVYIYSLKIKREGGVGNIKTNPAQQAYGVACIQLGKTIQDLRNPTPDDLILLDVDINVLRMENFEQQVRKVLDNLTILRKTDHQFTTVLFELAFVMNLLNDCNYETTAPIDIARKMVRVLGFRFQHLIAQE